MDFLDSFAARVLVNEENRPFYNLKVCSGSESSGINFVKVYLKGLKDIYRLIVDGFLGPTL